MHGLQDSTLQLWEHCFPFKWQCWIRKMMGSKSNNHKQIKRFYTLNSDCNVVNEQGNARGRGAGLRGMRFHFLVFKWHLAILCSFRLVVTSACTYCKLHICTHVTEIPMYWIHLWILNGLIRTYVKTFLKVKKHD